MAFPISRARDLPSLSVSVPLVLVPTRIGLALLLGTHLSLLGSYLSYTHGQRLDGFFRDIAISSVLNRFCSAGRAFRDKFFYFHGGCYNNCLLLLH